MKYIPEKFGENTINSNEWQQICEIQDGGGGHLEFR
jgi:hypothetical protein